MGTPIKPGIKYALKMDSFWLCPSMTGPKKSEIEAVSGLYITCFLTEENSGWTVTFNKGSGPRLLCMSNTPEVLLPSTVAGTDLVGVVDPQAAVGANDKKAFEFLRNGYSGWMARRHNKANDTSDLVTIGEFIDYAPIGITPAIIDKTATTAEGVYVFKAGVAITGDPVTNVAVVA